MFVRWKSVRSLLGRMMDGWSKSAIYLTSILGCSKETLQLHRKENWKQYAIIHVLCLWSSSALLCIMLSLMEVYHAHGYSMKGDPNLVSANVLLNFYCCMARRRRGSHRLFYCNLLSFMRLNGCCEALPDYYTHLLLLKCLDTLPPTVMYPFCLDGWYTLVFVGLYISQVCSEVSLVPKHWSRRHISFSSSHVYQGLFFPKK
jgi:hypothetical protein